MTLAIRTAERRAGINWGKLSRLRRDVESRRAKVRGLQEHRAEMLARRREARAHLAADLNARYALASVAAAEALPPIAWTTEPEAGLAAVPEALLRTVHIDPDMVDECLQLGDEIEAATRELAAAHVDLDQRSALLARLEGFAHHE